MQRGSSSRLLWVASRTLRVAETSRVGRSSGSSCGLCRSGHFDRKRTWPKDHAFHVGPLSSYGDPLIVVGGTGLRNRPGVGVNSQPTGRGAHLERAGRVVNDCVPVLGLSGRGTCITGVGAAWMGTADRCWFFNSSAVMLSVYLSRGEGVPTLHREIWLAVTETGSMSVGMSRNLSNVRWSSGVSLPSRSSIALAPA